MKLSVIIPVYNQEELVLRAIQSIPNREDIELIVIDDCSTDGTYEVVKLYSHYARREIILLHNDENKGVGYTTNKGLDIASGEYEVLLGSDDYFVNLENVIDLLDGTDLIYFPLELNDGSFWTPNWDNRFSLCGSVKFMRREFVGDLRNPEIRQAEDLDFNARLLKKNPTVKYLNRNIVYKHYNFPREGSLSWNAIHGG